MTCFILFVKRKRSPGSTDMKQQEKCADTDMCTCVMDVEEPKKAAQEDEKIEVGDSAS